MSIYGIKDIQCRLNEKYVICNEKFTAYYVGKRHIIVSFSGKNILISRALSLFEVKDSIITLYWFNKNGLYKNNILIFPGNIVNIMSDVDYIIVTMSNSITYLSIKSNTKYYTDFTYVLTHTPYMNKKIFIENPVIALWALKYGCKTIPRSVKYHILRYVMI